MTKFHQIEIPKKGIFYTLLLLILITLQAYCQKNEILITKEYSNLSWDEFVEKAEDNFDVHFFYHPDSIPGITVFVKSSPARLKDVLTEVFSPYDVNLFLDRFGNIFLTKGQTMFTGLPKDFFEYTFSKTNKPDTLELFTEPDKNFLKTNDEYVAQSRVVGTKKQGLLSSRAEVSGFVISLKDSLPIAGATVYVEDLESGSSTDDKGFYSLTLPKGNFTMNVRSVGFEEIKYKVDVLSGGRLDFYLPDKVFLMEAVEIRSQSHHNVRGIQMGFEKLTINDIKEIPVVLGERDIIRVALLLPGVQQIGEGSSGFNVRGSPADQNLFYISNIPVYNTSHLF
nr:carboxypeptidase-like regulatory domain-containing protein [Bacteroidota bacterium]